MSLNFYKAGIDVFALIYDKKSQNYHSINYALILGILILNVYKNHCFKINLNYITNRLKKNYI